MEPHAVAPAGMSYVNAFHAIWEDIPPLSLLEKGLPHRLVEEEVEVSTAKRVAGLFLRSFKQEEGEILLDIGFVGGRVVQADFEGFPTIRPYEIEASFDLREVDGEIRVVELRTGKAPSAVRAQFAQQALDAYQKIPSAERFDAGDRYNFTDLVELFYQVDWQVLAQKQQDFFSGHQQVEILRGQAP